MPKTDLLQRPLIIGASVSAGFLSTSPGDRLATRFTKPENILNVAVPGKPGAQHLATLTPPLFEGRTMVIALDFLFWDTVLPDKTATLFALDKLIDLSSKQGIPVLIGDVPELLPGRQRLRNDLNRILADKCRGTDRCFVLPLDALHRQVMRDRYLDVNGRRISFRELVPDGLHLAEVASEFLADFIYKQPVFHPQAG